MKHLLIVPIFAMLCLCNSVHAQHIVPEAVFANTSGVKQSKMNYYQVEGYSVFDAVEKFALDEKGVNKLRKKYRLSEDLPLIIDSLSQLPNYKCTSVHDDSGITTTSTYYFVPASGGKTRTIGFTTILARDTAVEQFFMKHLVDATIPPSVYIKPSLDSVSFIGRKFSVPSICGWRGLNNVQCSQQGQMNWTLHRTYDQAAQMTLSQLMVNKSKGMYELKKEEDINIEFEGNKTTAKKVTYKVNLPKLVMGNNILFVYYVTVLVRGSYVSCVLSYYQNQGNDQSLPGLLQQVMKVD